jgi:regulator of sirC expression with transglutaminase-like and TPR domain
MTPAEARQQFQRIVHLPDERIDLAEAALLVAAEEYADLDVGACLARLDRLAEAARPAVWGAADPRDRLLELARFVHVAQRFAGNRSDYYDARNSYLNEVLERRTGIPITLALVYLALGARLDLPLRGVGFPGHFLVRCEAKPALVLDPFEGILLERSECEARWRVAMPDEPFDAGALEPSPARAILARLIGNLKQIHLAAQDWARALACVERLLVLAPDSPTELRDRGLLYARLECFAAAATDLRRFLVLAPRDPSADAVRSQLLELAKTSPALH